MLLKFLKHEYLTPILTLGVSFYYGGNNLYPLLISIISLSGYYLLFPINYNQEKIPKSLIMSICIVFIYLIFQNLPLPSFIISLLSPKSFSLYNRLFESGSWMTISLNPLLTLKYIFSLMIFFLIIVITPHIIDTKIKLRSLWLTIIVIGVIHVIFGLIVYFFQITEIVFYKKIYYLNAVTGLFINRNNFSFFCVLMFINTIYFYNFSSKYFYFSKSKSLISFLMSDLFIIRLILVLFAIAIILTKSRAGNLTFFICLLMMLYLDFKTHKKWTFFSKTLLTVLIIDILFVSYYLGSEGLIERISVSTFEGEASRWEIFSYGLKKILEFPFFGYSMGNFSTLFRIELFQGGLFYDHVHNDFIELLGELGLIGVLVFFLFFYFYRKQYLIIKKSQKIITDIQKLLLVTLVVTLVHGFFDFSIHIPSNIILIGWMLGMGLSPLSRSIKKN